MGVGKGIEVHLETSCQLCSGHAKIDIRQVDARRIKGERAAELTHSESTLLLHVCRSHPQMQSWSSVNQGINAQIDVTHGDMCGIKAFTGWLNEVLIIVQCTTLPVQIPHLIYIIMQLEFGSLCLSLLESCTNTHRITGHMQTEISLDKGCPVNINVPKRTFLMRIRRDSVAQCDVNPSPFHIGFVHSYGVSGKVYGMTHHMQTLQIAPYAEVTNEVYGVCLELCESEFVHLYPTFEQGKQLNTCHQTVHISHSVFLIGYGIILSEHFQTVHLEV